MDDQALAALIPMLDDDGLSRIIEVAARLDGPELLRAQLAREIFQYFLDSLLRQADNQELSRQPLRQLSYVLLICWARRRRANHDVARHVRVDRKHFVIPVRADVADTQCRVR